MNHFRRNSLHSLALPPAVILAFTPTGSAQTHNLNPFTRQIVQVRALTKTAKNVRDCRSEKLSDVFFLDRQR